MARNPVTSQTISASMSAVDIVPVTPDDDTDLVVEARALRCKPLAGASGTLRITTASGEVRNTEIEVGEVLTVAVRRVHATGTTATGLEALI